MVGGFKIGPPTKSWIFPYSIELAHSGSQKSKYALMFPEIGKWEGTLMSKWVLYSFNEFFEDLFFLSEKTLIFPPCFLIYGGWKSQYLKNLTISHTSHLNALFTPLFL